jgi:hypothetical protein
VRNVAIIVDPSHLKFAFANTIELLFYYLIIMELVIRSKPDVPGGPRDTIKWDIPDEVIINIKQKEGTLTHFELFKIIKTQKESKSKEPCDFCKTLKLTCKCYYNQSERGEPCELIRANLMYYGRATERIDSFFTKFEYLAMMEGWLTDLQKVEKLERHLGGGALIYFELQLLDRPMESLTWMEVRTEMFEVYRRSEKATFKDLKRIKVTKLKPLRSQTKL